jgi:hypothetical protein
VHTSVPYANAQHALKRPFQIWNFYAYAEQTHKKSAKFHPSKNPQNKAGSLQVTGALRIRTFAVEQMFTCLKQQPNAS